MSETEAETNKIAADRNKRKSSTDLNTHAGVQSGKKPSATKKKMAFQEEVHEVQKKQLNFFQESKKRHMEFMEKMLTEQKKSDEVEKERDRLFFAVRKNICEK